MRRLRAPYLRPRSHPTPRGVPRPKRSTRPARAIAVLALVVLAGCGSAASTSDTTSPSAPGPASAGRSRLHIGEGATLRGTAPGEQLRVTLVHYAPSLSGSTNDHPEFDYQFVAAQVELSNVGSRTYAGAPDNDVTIVSTESQTSKKALLTEGSCADSFAAKLTLAPGQSAEGCVPAQILVVSTSAVLRFAPYGTTNASSSAEWSLKTPTKKRR